MLIGNKNTSIHRHTHLIAHTRRGTDRAVAAEESLVARARGLSQALLVAVVASDTINTIGIVCGAGNVVHSTHWAGVLVCMGGLCRAVVRCRIIMKQKVF